MFAVSASSALSARVQVPSQLKAKASAARRTSVTTRAFFGKKEPEAPPEEDNFWKKMFLKEGEKEAELNKQKAENAKNAKPKFLGLF